MEESQIPRNFISKRLHSLTGFFLVLFLIEHLLVNSQAALFFGDSGMGFTHAVNDIKDLPYLPILEILLLGIPFSIHMFLGVRYLFTGESNSIKIGADGTKPNLPEYGRNRAYTWQRVTSWILLFGILGHVIHMRFLEYPTQVKVLTEKGEEKHYLLTLEEDAGLPTVAARLGVLLLDEEKIKEERDHAKTIERPSLIRDLFVTLHGLFSSQPIEEEEKALEMQKKAFMNQWKSALKKITLKKGQVVAVAPNFGTAELLVVRETFKDPVMMILYTVLVLAASFHAFNGLWTFLITWGVTLTVRSQKAALKISLFLMGLITLLGLTAIWGTFFLNLRD